MTVTSWLPGGFTRRTVSVWGEEGATAVAAQLIQGMPIREPPDDSFPTVAEWALAFGRLSAAFGGDTGPLPDRMIDKAERLFRELQRSAPREMLLHGDLHHDNILSDEVSGWIAIDPKGVIGDPAYEAARLQHNPTPDFLAMDHPRAVVLRRVEILSLILHEDRARLLAWALFGALLAACWSIEKGADDWRYSLSCAEVTDGVV